MGPHESSHWLLKFLVNTWYSFNLLDAVTVRGCNFREESVVGAVLDFFMESFKENLFSLGKNAYSSTKQLWPMVNSSLFPKSGPFDENQFTVNFLPFLTTSKLIVLAVKDLYFCGLKEKEAI